MMNLTQDMKCYLFLLVLATTYNVVNTSQDRHIDGPRLDQHEFNSMNTGI